MMQEDSRMIFEADYTELRDKTMGPHERFEKFSKIFDNDPYIKTRPAELIKRLLIFMSGCVSVAQNARAELDVIVSSNYEKVTVIWSAHALYFDVDILSSLSFICLSAMNMTINSGIGESSKAMICLDFDLSE